MSGTVLAPISIPTPTSFARRIGYLFGGLPLSVAAFVTGMVGFALGVATLVVFVGIPVLVSALRAARGLAEVERRATEWATGRPLPPHHYRQRLGLLPKLAEPQSWRDLLHAVVSFPLRLACALIAIVWSAVAVGGVLSLLWTWSLPADGGLLHLVTGSDSYWGGVVVDTLAGLIALALLNPVLVGLVETRAWVVRALLTNRTAALRARAAQLESSRRSAVAAEAQTLRRLERDLHDGPQQRLVRLGMDLETLARRLDDDPAKARPLVDEALAQTREALGELRALSRGIAPPVLADRGLPAALTAAAARCPVPVELDVALADGRRLAPEVENTAYFVVSEALTNVAKHAGASACQVQVRVGDDRLLLRVRDDGHGGAHLGKGHGLAGLADRLSAVEGALEVVSPSGGPTVLTADIPLVGVGEGA